MTSQPPGVRFQTGRQVMHEVVNLILASGNSGVSTVKACTHVAELVQAEVRLCRISLSIKASRYLVLIPQDCRFVVGFTPLVTAGWRQRPSTFQCKALAEDSVQFACVSHPFCSHSIDIRTSMVAERPWVAGACKRNLGCCFS